MLKNLSVLLAFLLVLSIQTKSQAKQTKQHKTEQKSSAHASPILTQQSNPINPPTAHTENVYADVRVLSTPPKDSWDKTVLTVNALLLIVGIFGVVAAFRTLGKIKTQADEMALQRRAMEETLKAIERQATATEIQVQHMVEAERPFLMIEVRDGGSGSYHFYAVNYGRSPAQLVFINPIPILIAHEHDASLTSKPNYGLGYYDPASTVFNEQWIPPKGDRCIGTLDRSVVDLWVGHHPELETGMKELLAYGAIKYRGRNSKNVWESKYCYRTLQGYLRMAGPYGWNDYT